MGSRILLADDSITIQKVVNLTFADEGIDVVAVSSGDLAEKRLNEVSPDLVLADIFMPGKNGYELCEAIKQNPQFRNVPVVLLVGAFEPFDQNEARRVHADAHLTKPFESRTLIETVRRLITANPRVTTAPIAPAALPDDMREPARTTGPMASATSASLRSTTDELASNPAFTLQSTRNGGTAEQLDSNTEVVLADSIDRFEPMELSSDFAPVSEEPASNSALGSSEMVLDFDKSDVFGTPATDSVVSFDNQEGELLDVEVDGMPPSRDWSAHDDGNAGGFEIPSDTTLAQVPATTALESERPAEFNLTSSTTESSAEPLSTPVLATDDPLGDVLLDDTGVALDSGHAADVLSNDGLDVELAMPATELAQESNLVPQPAQSALETAPLQPEVARSMDQPARTAEAPAHSDAEANPTGDLDWTSPRARSFSTAQLDSAAMSMEARAHIDEVARDNGHSVSEKELGFAESAMTAQEEAHFAPIDIDAVDVTQPESDHATDFETGFSFSSVIEEEPAARVDDAPAPHQAAAYDARPAELSSAAIEEIVRRVVAQMSESVVREVAWEVVPDCVERVINQMTRDSMARRA